MAETPNNNAGTTSYSTLGTDEAMNLVLKAEHDAQAAVAACEQEARTLLEQARETAHRIAERSDARISRIHQRCSRSISDETNRIQQEAEQQRESEHAAGIDENIINAAVEHLAARLTGATAMGNVTELRQETGKSTKTDERK